MTFGELKIGEKFKFQYENYKKTKIFCARTDENEEHYFQDDCLVERSEHG